MQQSRAAIYSYFSIIRGKYKHDKYDECKHEKYKHDEEKYCHFIKSYYLRSTTDITHMRINVINPVHGTWLQLNCSMNKEN